MKQTNIDETKLVPIDAANMKPGEPVFLYKDGCVTEGMFVAYLPTANESYQSCIKLNDSGIPHFFTRDGRAHRHYSAALFRGPVPYKEVEPTFKIGQVFLIDGEYYILSHVAAQTYALINLNNGNRYHDAVKSTDYASAISVATLEACGAEPSDLVENAVINVTRGM